MKSQTSLVASQVRIQQWAAQIRECQNRPEDMDISTWCEMNGITKACYYYRLKKVRQKCLESTGMEFPTFVELEPVEGSQKCNGIQMDPEKSPAAVIHTQTGLAIDIFDSASDDMLERLFRVLSYAE